jgi:hypothetical protein
MSLRTRASVAVATVCLSLGLASAASAANLSVGVTPSVSISIGAHGSTTQKTYAQLLSIYQSLLGQINHNYGHRVAVALANYRKSLARARSAAEKLNARSTYRNAVVAATTEREVELEALGSPPSADSNHPGDGRDGGDQTSGN